MQLNLSAFLERSKANGPGERSVVWVQGCPIHCTGCFNPATWTFAPHMLVEVRELAERILAVKGIEGVTFSGGEPFAQAAALAELGTIIAAEGLSIVTFTGYTLAELEKGVQPDCKQLLAVCDLLVAGRFIAEQRCNLPLRGSANQQLIFLTEKLRNHPELTLADGQLVEYIIDEAGNLVVTGFQEG
ncbi:MAG TPA: 4Fe-4S single cluster domain-containing protein [Negativicutes bacterium]|jgi:anaerobic ribonucleoside-triphosphate reductase activating protein